MSTINAQVVVKGPSAEITLKVVSAELLEYLYHNEASLPLITPVSIKSVSQLVSLLVHGQVILSNTAITFFFSFPAYTVSGRPFQP